MRLQNHEKIWSKALYPKKDDVHFCRTDSFLLILLVFVNGTFAEWYYMANKRSDLVSIYKEISKVQEKDLLGNDSEVLKLNRMTERNNVSVLLIDSSMRVQYANVYDVSILIDQVQDYVLGTSRRCLTAGTT